MSIIKNERGSAILVALAILIMLGVIGTAAIQTSVTDLNITDNLKQDMRSFYLAESGIEHAYGVLRDSVNWRDGLSNYTLSGGSYTVVILDKTSQPALGDTLVFISTGVRSGAQSTVEVKFTPTRPFKWSAFADSAISLCGDTYTDSYDSDSGTYASTMRLEDGDVGSNGMVDVCGTAQINGDAGSSTPGDMEIDGAAEVTGDTTTTAPVQVFDPVADEDIDYAKANSMAPAGLTGDFNYNNGTRSLSVNPGRTVTLADGIYYFKDIDLRGNLEIAPGAQVQIYITGDVSVNSMSTVNAGGKPVNLQIYSIGDNITINGGAEIRAVIYAPDTQIRLTGGADLYGAYIGNVATDNGGSNFHYDRSLRDKEIQKRYSKVSWREIT